MSEEERGKMQSLLAEKLTERDKLTHEIIELQQQLFKDWIKNK